MSQTNLEATLQDTLNAGIGLIRSVESRTNALRAQIEAGYAGLVTRGAADQTTDAVKLRALLDQGVTQIKEARLKLKASAD